MLEKLKDVLYGVAALLLVVCSVVFIAGKACGGETPGKFGAAPPLVGSPAPMDTAIGDLQSTVVSFPQGAIQFLVKSSGGYFLCVNGFNEGTATGWLDCFNASALDAGALDGQVPSMVPVRIPAGAGFSLCEPQAFGNGIACYSSSTAGVYTTGGAQSISADFTIR